jgi:hypothetical protein
MVRPEIEKTLQLVMLQEAEYEQLLNDVNEQEAFSFSDDKAGIVKDGYLNITIIESSGTDTLTQILSM